MYQMLDLKLLFTADEKTENDANLLRALFAAAVWAPFFAISTRVKQTFVLRRVPENGLVESFPAAEAEAEDIQVVEEKGPDDLTIEREDKV
jgi:hypothetical protein